MSEINWFEILPALLGGGAMGALLTAVITAIRSRRQPIGHRIEAQPMFAPIQEDTSLSAKVTISKEGSDFSFSNLFLVQAQVVNKGNTDHESFPFGLTLNGKDQAIFVEPREPDRHHHIKVQTPVGPANPKSRLDFALEPFNRRDSYALNIFVVGEEPTSLGEIEIGSSQPVRFVSMPTANELLAAATDGVSFGVGLLKINISSR